MLCILILSLILMKVAFKVRKQVSPSPIHHMLSGKIVGQIFFFFPKVILTTSPLPQTLISLFHLIRRHHHRPIYHHYHRHPTSALSFSLAVWDWLLLELSSSSQIQPFTTVLPPVDHCWPIVLYRRSTASPFICAPPPRNLD